MAFARCSSLDRLLKCAGGAVLGGNDEKSDRAKEAADWGSLNHHWKATGEIKQVNDWKNHPALFKRKLEKSGIKREHYWPDDFVHEIPLAIDPVAGVAVTTDSEDPEAWKRGQDDRWCTGTADGYGWLFEKALWVDDLKTGRFATLEDYESQLLAYALGVSRLLNYRGQVYVTVTHLPRYPNHGLPTRVGRVVEQDELRDFEGRLAKLRTEILYAKKNVRMDGPGGHAMKLTAGDQCTWCPSRGVCPEFAKGMN